MEGRLNLLAGFYGFEKIALSLFEEARVFSPLQKSGMFEERPPVFVRGRSGPELLLRPSGSLSTLRAYQTHKMNDWPQPLKFIFSGEGFGIAGTKKVDVRPEWGLVMIGEEGPIAEAEIIQVIWKSLEELKVDMSVMELRINATGCSNCRSSFRSPFTSYLRGRQARFCKNCKRNFKRFPTKILVCQEEKCKLVANHAPQILDYLCEVCKKHLRGLLEFLDEMSIPYFLDPKFFRDGSWFSTMSFEFVWRKKSASALPENTTEDHIADTQKKLPSAVVVVEGGRISRAGELINGKKLDAASATVLLENLTENFGKILPVLDTQEPKIFLAQLGDLAKRKSLALMEDLRQGGIGARESLGRDSIKSQLNVAEKVGADIALIFGQKEALDSTIIVREVSSGIQETIPQAKLIEFLRKKLKK